VRRAVVNIPRETMRGANLCAATNAIRNKTSRMRRARQDLIDCHPIDSTKERLHRSQARGPGAPALERRTESDKSGKK